MLDEATSAVDNETEAAIQRSLKRIGHNRTVIMIAHRLSTIVDADTIAVVAGGRILESGRHEELLENNGPIPHNGAYRPVRPDSTPYIARHTLIVIRI